MIVPVLTSVCDSMMEVMMKVKTQIRLSGTAGGRILLHCICVLRDAHVKSHFCGILRELKVETA